MKERLKKLEHMLDICNKPEFPEMESLTEKELDDCIAKLEKKFFNEIKGKELSELDKRLLSFHKKFEGK